jgi:hypothetical protein
MIILSSPSVLDHFHSERQRRLRPAPHPGNTTPTPARLRVRIGHALIGAGTALSGESAEPARSNPRPRTA